MYNWVQPTVTKGGGFDENGTYINPTVSYDAQAMGFGPEYQLYAPDLNDPNTFYAKRDVQDGYAEYQKFQNNGGQLKSLGTEYGKSQSAWKDFAQNGLPLMLAVAGAGYLAGGGLGAAGGTSGLSGAGGSGLSGAALSEPITLAGGGASLSSPITLGSAAAADAGLSTAGLLGGGIGGGLSAAFPGVAAAIDPMAEYLRTGASEGSTVGGGGGASGAVGSGSTASMLQGAGDLLGGLKKLPITDLVKAGGLLGGALGGGSSGDPYNGPMPTISRGNFQASVTPTYADVNPNGLLQMPTRKNANSGLWQFLGQ